MSMTESVYDATLFCPECRTPAEPGTRVCPSCGQVIRAVECPVCGTPVGVKNKSTYENVAGRHVIKEFTEDGTPTELICPVRAAEVLDWEPPEWWDGDNQ
jgi:predicted amidophosphoribosyltransferase